MWSPGASPLKVTGPIVGVQTSVPSTSRKSRFRLTGPAGLTENSNVAGTPIGAWKGGQVVIWISTVGS